MRSLGTSWPEAIDKRASIAALPGIECSLARGRLIHLLGRHESDFGVEPPFGVDDRQADDFGRRIEAQQVSSGVASLSATA